MEQLCRDVNGNDIRRIASTTAPDTPSLRQAGSRASQSFIHEYILLQYLRIHISPALALLSSARFRHYGKRGMQLQGLIIRTASHTFRFLLTNLYVASLLTQFLKRLVTEVCQMIRNQLMHSFEKKKKKVVDFDLYSASTRSVSNALRYSTHCHGITQFYLHTVRAIRNFSTMAQALNASPSLFIGKQQQEPGAMYDYPDKIYQARVEKR